MSYIKCCSPEISGTIFTLQPVADPVNVPFRFRDLPKELRFMVYEYALSFDSIDKYFEDYLDDLCTTNQERMPAPEVKKVCPSILLVNKEMTEEALPILYSTPLHLSYGICKAHLEDVISLDLLRKLRYINLSDSGSRHLNPPPHDSFTGYCFSAVELAKAFRGGHSLKSLTLDYSSAYIKIHLEKCLNVPGKACGIKSWSHNLVRALKELHNVKKVSLDIAWSGGVKRDIVNSIKSPARGFFALPFHVRQKIYSYAADYNEGIAKLQRATKDLAYNIDPTFHVKKTPTVLLINKQITQEAQAVIYSKPLTISNLYPVTNGTFPKLEDCLSLGVFKKLQHLELRFTDYRHLNLLFTIAHALKRRSTKLKSLVFDFSEPRQKRLLLESAEYYPDHIVWQPMRALNHLRGVVEKVEITGSLPDNFARAVVYNMTEKKEDEPARPLVVQNIEGWEVDVHVIKHSSFYRQIRGILMEN